MPFLNEPQRKICTCFISGRIIHQICKEVQGMKHAHRKSSRGKEGNDGLKRRQGKPTELWVRGHWGRWEGLSQEETDEKMVCVYVDVPIRDQC